MQEVKTPNKRNSLANQNAFKSVKKEKHTPNKSPNKAIKGEKSPFKKVANSPKIELEPNTDKVNQNKTGIPTPNKSIKKDISPFKKVSSSSKIVQKTDTVVQNETNIQSPNKANKRKSFVSKMSNDAPSPHYSPKKPKLEAFTGTSNYISTNSNTASDVKVDKLMENILKKKKIKQSKDKIEGNKTQEKHNGRKHSKLRRKRTQTKYSELIEKLKEKHESTQDIVDDLNRRIALMKQQPKLSATSKKKMRSFKRIIRFAGIKVDDNKQHMQINPEKITKTQKMKQFKEQKQQKALNNLAKSKMVEINPEEDTQKRRFQAKKQIVSNEHHVVNKQNNEGSEGSGDSDYDMEDSFQIDKIAKDDEHKSDSEAQSDDDDEEVQDDDSEVETDDDNENDEVDSDDEEKQDSEGNNENDIDGKDDSSEQVNSDDETKNEGLIKEEQVSPSFSKTTAKIQNKIKSLPNKKMDDDGTKKSKSRYIVYVSNVPYDADKQEIIDHFAKIGIVKDVRIPTDIKTKKPRGFAYLEVNDQETYEKALSLHHTFLKGRRINVLYTQGGKKKGDDRKKEIKVKNFKLNEMRKQGMLAGSVKETQKRSARRAKKNNMQKESE